MLKPPIDNIKKKLYNFKDKKSRMKGSSKMEKEILIFGHKNPDTDSICSSIVMENLEKKMGKVIDHHTMNFKAPYQLYYRTEPVGCTATVLYKLYKENGIEIEKNIAILCLSAIISDTLLLKSPTTTEDDKKALKELAEIDVNEYGIEMLKAGTDLDDFSAEELINLDAKKFEKDATSFVIAQVNTVSIEDVLKREEELKAAMNKTIEEKGLDLFVFAITDILNSNSEIIALGEKTDVIKLAYGKELENDKAFLEGVVSRKKQLLPEIDKNI